MVVRLLLSLGLLLLSAQGLATVKTYVDRNPVTVNESFLLTFEVDGEVAVDPDFDSLRSLFEVLNISQNSSIQIINGQTSHKRFWQLTLMPLKEGSYRIPVIDFGKDKSKPLTLIVNKASKTRSDDNDSLILQVDLTPEDQVYVQSQLVYTRRLLRSVKLREGGFSELKISGVEAIVERLGENRNYEVMRNGVRYLVAEQSFAIFPQQSGTLSIKPTFFQGRIASASRFSISPARTSKRLVSKPYEIEVKPIPAGAQQPWLPLGKLDLEETWPEDSPQFKVGEPVTRTLTLSADGIASKQLPALSSRLPDGLKYYPDQAELNDSPSAKGLRSTRREKLAIIPSEAGTFTLPAIEIPWWNTRTDQQEVARIPERVITVESPDVTAPPAPIGQAQITPNNETFTPKEAPAITAFSAGFWPWLSLLLALGWAATLVIGWRVFRNRNSRADTSKPAKADLGAIKRACKQHDAAACKTALLGWAQAQWPQQPPTGLGAIARRVDDEFAAALDELNGVLYAPENTDWNGDRLLRAIQSWRKSADQSANPETSAIASLHPRREAIG